MNAQLQYRFIDDAAQGFEGKFEHFTSSLSASSPSGMADRILKELHAINYCYLQWLAKDFSNRYSISESNRGLGVIARLLSPLSSNALALAAQCPYSLFDVAFDNFERWQNYCEGPTGVRSSGGENTNTLVVTVLFFAWHLASAIESRVLAQSRLLLGMHPQTAQHLRRVPLWRLCEIAVEAGPLLQPRWSNHPRFWPDLVRSVSKPEPGALRTVRLLGRQLLAAEAIPGCTASRQTVNKKAPAV